MLIESGPDQLTMDALAERSGLGKGTVFRRFGSRAGIFQGLLDEMERGLQEQVLSGPPPLGPGAPPVDRLVAYGRARVRWLIENTEIARFALDGRQPIPSGSQMPASQMHIRMLLHQMSFDGVDVDLLAIQLTAALDGPLLLYLSADALTSAAPQVEQSLGSAWQDLVERVCRP